MSVLILGKRLCHECRGFSLSPLLPLHRDLGCYLDDFFDLPDKVRMLVLDLASLPGKLTTDSNIEVDVGIMCACMPILPALIKDWSLSSRIQLSMTSIRSRLFKRADRNQDSSSGSNLADKVREPPLQNPKHFAQRQQGLQSEIEKPTLASPKRPLRPPIIIPDSCLRVPVSPVMEEAWYPDDNRPMYRSIEIL